ncbi:MAG TPA: hypothetical protein VGL94_15575 [Ktedonobacteraceae bacterium]|jgi:hypothetical protein
MLTGQILLQLIVVLLVVQLFGHLSGRIGQQWVIGEIMAILTTMMASPFLPLLGYRTVRQADQEEVLEPVMS